MTKNKFKVNDIVLYQNGDRFELGVVKKVVPQPFAKVIKTVNAEEITEDFNYVYFVNYHIGSTAALTDEEDLHSIANLYAFLILRRSVDKDNKPSEELAEFLVACSPIKFDEKAEQFVETYTNIINDWTPGQERIEV